MPSPGGRPKAQVGRPIKNLLESDIRAAQSISISETDACRKLGVSWATYKKYAVAYGLFGRIKNPGLANGKKPIRKINPNSGRYPLNDVLTGKYPEYSTSKLKCKILKHGILESKCAKCGFCEKRIADNTTPLLLNYIDGDERNKKLENIELLCYNCYYMWVNNPFGHRQNFKLTPDEPMVECSSANIVLNNIEKLT